MVFYNDSKQFDMGSQPEFSMRYHQPLLWTCIFPAVLFTNDTTLANRY